MRARDGMLSVVLWLTAASPGAAQGEDVWRVVYNEFHPYTYTDENGQAAGYGNELMRALAAQEGARLTFEEVPNPAAVVEALAEGRADVNPTLVPTDERRQFVRFTAPHSEIRIRGFALREGAPEIAARWPRDISVAVARGSYPEGVARAIPGLEVVPSSSNAEAVFAVASGSVDVVAYAEATFADFVRKLEMESRFVPVSPSLSEVPLALAVTPSAPVLYQRLDSALTRFVATDEFVRLRATRLDVLVTGWASRETIVAVVGASSLVGLVAGLLLLWQRQRAQLALTLSAEERAMSEAGAAAALRVQNAKLEARTREVENLVYVVSHDLSSPLVSISGFAKRASMAFEKGDAPKARQHLSRVEANVESMSSLIDGILQMSRISRAVKKKQVVDIEAEFEQLSHALAGTIEAVGAHLTLDGSGSIETDPQLLRQALQNLVENALRHGCPEPGATVRVGVSHMQDATVLTVSDDGPGIPTDNRERLFEMFQRGVDVTVPGSGLGLAIVARIADQTGALFSLASSPGEGTTFSLAFGTADEMTFARTRLEAA